MEIKERLNDLLSGKQGDYILPFFWQHGEDEATLRRYMRVIHGANIASVCVESRPHEGFLGEKWWADMDAILDEAKRLGMRVWILDDKHFPTGFAAGAVEHAPKELCHLYLDYNTASVCGPMPCAELDVEKMAHPRPVPPWMPQGPSPKRVFRDDHLFRVLACPVEAGGALGDALDLTDSVRDGRLRWDVPSGYWQIYVVYLTRDAKGRNDYINLLDMASCRLLIDTVYEPHYRHYKHLFGNVIAGFFSDEPPIGNCPGYMPGNRIGKPDMPLAWSDAMPARMQAEYGEGWARMLPYLWAQGNDAQGTAHIRTAYMNAVSKLVEECFSNQIGSWCEARGVEYIGHMLEDCDDSAALGPSMGHFFRGLSGQHMAGIDNIGGQVMVGGQDVRRHLGGECQDDAGFYHYLVGRMGASMAAIDPKKQGRCMCENFGAYGWQTGVRLEKYLTDHFLARGVNRFVPHAFSPAPFPDPDCPPHFYAQGENPQLRAFGELMAYTNRVCHLIDGGRYASPVAILYNAESQWSGAYESNIHACRALARAQIGFTLIPDDVFTRPETYRTRFDAAANTLFVGGVEFSALVVSGCEFMPRASAVFCADAAACGFPVLFTERAPIGICDCGGDESRAILERLCEARVVPTDKLAEALRNLRDGAPDAAFDDLTVYHYENGGDVYLFLNESPHERFCGEVALCAAPTLRYDAWENRVTAVQADGNRLRLELEPLEMAVILCAHDLPAPETTPLRETQSIPLRDLTVSYADAKAYPAFTGRLAADLRNGMGLALPDFSGFLRYETTAELPRGARVTLEIEDAYESAEVFVNGQSAGMKVAKPFVFDITALVREGRNEIAIEIATTLARKAALIGADVACMSPLSPLAPIGVIGGVTVRAFG